MRNLASDNPDWLKMINHAVSGARAISEPKAAKKGPFALDAAPPLAQR
jgi:hypothetical protein